MMHLRCKKMPSTKKGNYQIFLLISYISRIPAYIILALISRSIKYINQLLLNDIVGSYPFCETREWQRVMVMRELNILSRQAGINLSLIIYDGKALQFYFQNRAFFGRAQEIERKKDRLAEDDIGCYIVVFLYKKPKRLCILGVLVIMIG